MPATVVPRSATMVGEADVKADVTHNKKNISVESSELEELSESVAASSEPASLSLSSSEPPSSSSSLFFLAGCAFASAACLRVTMMCVVVTSDVQADVFAAYRMLSALRKTS